MAHYSPELMRRIASHSLGSNSASNWSWRDGFLSQPENLNADRLVAVQDRDPQSKVSNSGTSSINYDQYYKLQATFDPDTEQDSVDPLEYKFERRDGRVFLRMYAWFTVGELEQFYTDHNQALLVCNKYYNYAYYQQITLRVAVRRAADADLPENWVGAKDPDIRLVYDHTKPSHFRVLGDLLVDVTDLLCSSSRYPELVGDWKTRFGAVREYDLRIRESNVALVATVTSDNALDANGNVTVIADGLMHGVQNGAPLWNPIPDADGRAVAQFAFDRRIALGRVEVFGYSQNLNGGSHYAPYNWFVEASNNGVTWQPVKVTRHVSLCSEGASGVIQSDLSTNKDPVIVEIDPKAGAFSHFRFVFLDHYTELEISEWSTIPIREIELYELL